MIVRIAGDEFIEQGRRKIGSKSRHETCGGADEIGVRVIEGVAVLAPEGTLVDRSPSVVDIAEREALVIGEVVIHADQLFAPVGGKTGVGYVYRNRVSRGLAAWICAQNTGQIVGGRNE